MAVRTKQLAARHFNGDANLHEVYTCPADVTAIVKEVVIWTSTTGSDTLWLILDPGGSGNYLRTMKHDRAAVTDPQISAGRFMVLEPGDVLRLYNDGGGTLPSVDIVVSGSELDGVAP